MKKHNGMRPQDIVVLLKILALGDEKWTVSGIGQSLSISASEISESLNRSRIANLTDHNKKQVYRQNLMEFLEHGVRYVFPQQPGAMVRGIPTAHAHPFMKKKITSAIDYVWPDNKGEVLGLMIEPFYPRQTDAVKQDEMLYKLLALVDVIRVGKVREIKYAVEELKRILL